MVEGPYTAIPGKIEEYMKKIQEVGTPKKIDRAWLKSIGFSGGNDYYIIGVWKYIGFIDESSTPTEKWIKYKNPREARAILAQAIREGYSELFSTYPDAFRKDREALYSFFSSTGKAAKTVNAMVSTFQNLCKSADFEAEMAKPEEPATAVSVVSMEEKPTVAIEEAKPTITRYKGINEIHINIQLHLPETKDSTIYDSLFKSMKKYLLSDEDE